VKTDHPIYLFLSTGAEAFRVLTGGHQLVGEYRFCSLTIKGLERRLDGIFEPEGHAGPVYVVEFQGQYAAGAWYNPKKSSQRSAFSTWIFVSIAYGHPAHYLSGGRLRLKDGS